MLIHTKVYSFCHFIHKLCDLLAQYTGVEFFTRQLYYHITAIILSMKFKKFVLKNYPTNDFPQDLSCFELKHDAQLDQSMVKEGESLIKIFWVSVDPLLRTWISGAKSYIESVGPGSSIPGFGIAKIIKIIKKAGKKTFLE